MIAAVKRVGPLLAALCFLALALAPGHAPAADAAASAGRGGASYAGTGGEQPPVWDARLETTWIPASEVRASGTKVSMESLRFGLQRQFSLTPRLDISTGLRYSLTRISAAHAARLPASLHSLAATFRGEYDLSDDLGLNFSVSPGLRGDFKAIGASDVRVPIALYAVYQTSERLSLLGGLSYTLGNRRSSFFPVAGVVYRPFPKWTLELGFPRTAVIFQPRETAQYYLGGNFTAGEYRLHDSSRAARILSYRDYRLLAGGLWTLSTRVKVGLSGGYALARKFILYDGNREDVPMKSAPFGRLEIRVAW